MFEHLIAQYILINASNRAGFFRNIVHSVHHSVDLGVLREALSNLVCNDTVPVGVYIYMLGLHIVSHGTAYISAVVKFFAGENNPWYTKCN